MTFPPPYVSREGVIFYMPPPLILWIVTREGGQFFG